MLKTLARVKGRSLWGIDGDHSCWLLFPFNNHLRSLTWLFFSLSWRLLLIFSRLQTLCKFLIYFCLIQWYGWGTQSRPTWLPFEWNCQHAPLHLISIAASSIHLVAPYHDLIVCQRDTHTCIQLTALLLTTDLDQFVTAFHQRRIISVPIPILVLVVPHILLALAQRRLPW